MTTFQALTIMIGFGGVIIASLSLTVAIVALNQKK